MKYVYIKIFIKKIFVVRNWLIESEKSPNLLSASWRPKIAGGMMHSKFKDLRTRGVDGVRLSSRAED